MKEIERDSRGSRKVKKKKKIYYYYQERFARERESVCLCLMEIVDLDNFFFGTSSIEMKRDSDGCTRAVEIELPRYVFSIAESDREL